ncbi:Cytochrome P450 [Mycena indigotica]|uniref:Cytochrome P450 n=1 Tax=Mycena indigotica TaxID=2126181 RepID=A0A8H6SDD4_9AGAR|nr:Cytochrome P450 [Mycena indigotica]KAF7297364.1 Cytochrome P450 [Mycena indigotica]
MHQRCCCHSLVRFRSQSAVGFRMLSSMHFPSQLRLNPTSVLASLAVVLTIGNTLLSLHLWQPKEPVTTYSYVGNDFPEFFVPQRGPLASVAMTMEESRHYAVFGPEALAEWVSNSPKGFDYVRLGSEYRGFAVAMWHELHCLHVIRVVLDGANSPMAVGHLHHCLNYLRQYILCNPNLTLEPADLLTRDFENDLTEREGATHVCVDWAQMYGEMEDNWAEWEPIRAFVTRSFVFASGAYAVYRLGSMLKEALWPTCDIPGPHNPSLFWGNFREMRDDPQTLNSWHTAYGRIFKFRSLFSFSQLYTTDTRALTHILFKTEIYQKSPSFRENAERYTGVSVNSLEGEEHERHRKILTPIFSMSQIRQLNTVFLDKAAQLRDLWTEQVTQGKAGVVIDVYPWMRRFATDVVGQAGFDYNFHLLDGTGETNEFYVAIKAMLHSPNYFYHYVFRSAQDNFPILRWIRLPGGKQFDAARESMFAIATKIMEERKELIRSSSEKHTSKDLLSVLIKANLGIDAAEDRRFSDHEVVCQIPALITGATESSSIGMSWLWYVLAAYPEIQKKLREELQGLSARTSQPTMDELNGLPYLESVIRETMRLHSPVSYSWRMAYSDDLIPLSTPFIDQRGRIFEALPVKKGQRVYVPVSHVNTDKALWGDDALEFKPERWAAIPDAANGIPGVYANNLVFWAGPHGCIGYRFALAEIKALIFTILLAFEFELSVPKEDVGKTTALALARPLVLSQRAQGPQMPLRIKPYNS